MAPDFGLPLEAVTETFALLAIRGAGKSNASRVLAEEMYPAHLPFVAVDPVGAWWGLRAARDGRGPGLRIPIFGGRHADVPLERTGGVLIADLIVDTNLSCVLDLSEFEDEDKWQFLLDFARRLYRRNRDPRHLFLEEADDYIPQEIEKGQKPLLKAWTNIVRRGRARGLGCTLITQRHAALNKHVLSQVETLIALRTVGPNDRDAIGHWLQYHPQRQEILTSLAGLQDGEAWVVSPKFLGRTARVRFRLARTFDSGATPKVGRRRRSATLADVNLAEIQQRMVATIERAQAEDPLALQAEIARLRAELAVKPKALVVKLSAERAPSRGHVQREARSMARVTKRRERVLTTLYGLAQQLHTGAAAIERLATAAGKVLDRIQRTVETVPSDRVSQPPPAPSAPPRSYTPDQFAKVLKAAKGPKAVPASNGAVVPRTHRKVLNALAWWLAAGVPSPTRGRAAFLAGYTPTGGAFSNYLGAMRTAGLIEYPAAGAVSLTARGLLHVEKSAVPLRSVDIHIKIREILPAARWRVLEPLLARYPEALDRATLGAACGMEPAGGAFSNYLGALRTAGCLEYPRKGMVRAHPDLFVEVARG